jgi:histidyl-tRNA synthetase
MPLYQKAAVAFREAGVTCEVFPDAKKMPQQYTWAEKKGIQWGITLDSGGSAAILKNLATRETLASMPVAEAAKKILSRS